MVISYTLKNTTQDIKEESGWKVFPQNGEGTYFGIQGELLPGREITRSFTFSIVAPNALLVFAYPSKITDSSWDEDDLTWIQSP